VTEKGLGPAEKVVLVTGATSGIGYYTARDLAARGATVLITGRDQRRGAEAAAEITAAAGHSRVEFLAADHCTVAGNQGLGRAVPGRLEKLGRHQRLDVLVNNVGGIFATRTLTPDGYEATLALNFLAPVVVTNSVLPLLRAAQSARCVNVISSVPWLIRQWHGDLLDDLDYDKHDYVGIQAHARAKLLTAAWTGALARELSGTPIAVTELNPGTAWTSMTRSLTPVVVPAWRYVYPVVRFFQRRADPAKAGRLCVQLAWDAAAAEIDGKFFEHGKPGKLPASLLDPDLQARVVEVARDLEQRAPTVAS